MDIISYDEQKISINNETPQDFSLKIMNKGSCIQGNNRAVKMRTKDMSTMMNVEKKNGCRQLYIGSKKILARCTEWIKPGPKISEQRQLKTERNEKKVVRLNVN